MSLKNIFHPSGGLYYHLKAFRYQSQWASFKKELNNWLKIYFENRKRVLILGSSAGYCLSDETLSLAHSFDCFDQDSLAPYLWRKQHHQQPRTFFSRDVCQWLIDSNENQRAEKGPKIEDYDLILFNNFLGQLRFDQRLNDPAKPDFLMLLREKLLLMPSDWLSYHDLYSFHSQRKLEFRQTLKKIPDSPVDEGVLQTWLFEALSEGSRKHHKRIEIYDHEPILPKIKARDHRLFVWPLTPLNQHLIEGVSFSKAQ